MLIIHSFYAENSFYLWGERSFEPEEVLNKSGLGADVTALPWGALALW